MPVAWKGLFHGLHGLLCASRWSRDEVLSFQARRLRSVVRHAYERVPFYRRLFDQAGIRPEDIHGLSDLQRIPLTSRSHLQDLGPNDIVARGVNPDSLVVHRASGSSGAPLTIRRDWLEERLLLAYRLRTRLGQGRRWTELRTGLL
jgi:phenylacetate-coenzyme A ligase PaaK-like adenylate-forming protein